jgi:6-pyruvoyltetrahydropterin/6-carboxytetrahydropterin synthase
MYLNGNLGAQHPHTWEITLNTAKIKDNFIIFNDIENSIENYLKRFQNSYLNEVEPFDILNPTLENICEYFKDSFQSILMKKYWILLSIEISETPTRSYIIDVSDELESNRRTMSLEEKSITN